MVRDGVFDRLYHRGVGGRIVKAGSAEYLVVAEPCLGGDSGDGGQRACIGLARGNHGQRGAMAGAVARGGVVRQEKHGFIAARHDDLAVGVGGVAQRISGRRRG